MTGLFLGGHYKSHATGTSRADLMFQTAAGRYHQLSTSRQRPAAPARATGLTYHHVSIGQSNYEFNMEVA